jgi:hypothetical protein
MMKIFTKFIYIAFVHLYALSFFAHSSYAQQQQKYGMQSLKPKSLETVEPKSQEGEPEPELEPAYKPLIALSPKDALIEPEDLEKWTHLNEVALANSDSQIKKLIHIIESDRGAVPPQGLFLAAKSLADRNLMEQAAVYFSVGQLRLAFDMQRWPSVQNKDDLKRKDEDAKKTSDQSAPNQDTPARIDNPHSGIQSLSQAIGQPIIAWMLKDPARMNKVLNQARAWDASSNYQYLPDYDLTEPIAFEKWERTLKKVRETYFERMDKIMKAMERVKK